MALTVLPCHVPIRASRSAAIARSFRIETTQHATGYGQTWRVTDAPHSIVVLEEDGSHQTYSPIVRIEGDTVEQTAQLGERSTRLIISTQDDASFDTDDGRRGLLDAAWVYEFVTDWRYPHLAPFAARKWRVADYRPESTRVTLDLVGISSDLRRDRGNQFQPGCLNEFGDPLTCDLGGSISGHATLETGFVEYLVSDEGGTQTRKSITIIEDATPFDTEAKFYADWWANGVIRFTSGRNVGVVAVVEANTIPEPGIGAYFKTTLTLVSPLAWAPEEDDTVDLRVGCMRTRAVCQSKFDNLDNFRAFDLQPGSDLLRTTPEAT